MFVVSLTIATRLAAPRNHELRPRVVLYGVFPASRHLPYSTCVCRAVWGRPYSVRFHRTVFIAQYGNCRAIWFCRTVRCFPYSTVFILVYSTVRCLSYRAVLSRGVVFSGQYGGFQCSTVFAVQYIVVQCDLFHTAR